MCERTKALQVKVAEANKRITATIDYFKKLIEELEGRDKPPLEETDDTAGNPT